MHNPLIGQIELWPVNWEVADWVACDGRMVAMRGNPALYSILGDKFGGDQREHFALPDLRSHAPQGMCYLIRVQNAMYPTREW